MDASTAAAAEEGGLAEMEQDHGCLSAFIDTGSVESHRLYLARRTTLEMLRDRGYGIAVTDIEMSLADFRAAFGDANPDLAKIKIEAVLLRDPSQRILVIFCGAGAVKLSTARDLAALYGKESLSCMILVLQSNMTSKTRESLKFLFPFKVETFHITELLINITKHALMPNHEPLSAKEKQKLLKKYSIEENQLPRMLESDAIARYYGYEKGTVLKITYDGELTGNHVTHRTLYTWMVLQNLKPNPMPHYRRVEDHFRSGTTCPGPLQLST